MVDPSPIGVPELSDGTVRLRAHRPEDLAGIVEQCQDPESRQWLKLPEPYGEAEGREFLDRVAAQWRAGEPTSPRHWAIEATDDDGASRFAGSVNYRPDGSGGAEIGYGLHPWARGRGVTERAVRLALGHAFDTEGIEVMRWRATVGNFGSRRTAWRCGFTVAATVRGLQPRPGRGPQDGWIGTLRAEEPRTPRHRWLAPPRLAGERVVLRPWREEDRHGLVFDDAAEQFVGPVLPGTDGAAFGGWLLRMREQMARGQGVDWCLADPETDAPLGWLGVFGLGQPFEHGSGTVGYWMVPAGRGRGALTEALHLVAEHAFSAAPGSPPGRSGPDTAGLGLHRLVADTDWRNAASQGALVRAGWRWVGTEQDGVGYGAEGPFADNVRFELAARPATRAGIQPGLPTPPTLTAEQVVLRPFRAEDLPIMAEMLQNPDVGQGHDARAGLEEAARWWSAIRHRQWSGDAQTWAVCATDAMTGLAEPIGWLTAALRNDPLRPDRPLLDCWIAPEHRGAGFSHEALEAALGYLGADPEDGGAGLAEARAQTTADNRAGLTVLRRAGFTEWGREREADGAVTVHLRIAADEDRVLSAVRDVVTPVEVPTIEGERVRLRAWRHQDAERVVAACTDPVSQRFLADLPRSYTRAEARTFISLNHEASAAGRMLPWCLADPESDECLGALSIMGLSAHRSALGRSTTGEIGYWTHPDARGRGVMREALALAVRHAFVDVADGGLGLDRLELHAAASNTASQGAARRAGFTEVGRDRRAERLGDNTFEDLVRFDLLKEEWATRSRGSDHP